MIGPERNMFLQVPVMVFGPVRVSVQLIGPVRIFRVLPEILAELTVSSVSPAWK